MIGFQFLALVFVLVMAYVAYFHYRKGEINNLELIFWLSIWIGAVAIILFPKVFYLLGQTIAIARPFDLAVLAGFIILVPLTYILYIKANRSEKKIEGLIRVEALKSVKSQGKFKPRKLK